MDDTIVIGDPTNKVVVAIARGLDEEAVATAYAEAIRRIGATEPDRLGLGDPGWKRANLAMVARWGDAGRDRVKERAWAIVKDHHAATTLPATKADES